jgi:ABC-type Fe3+ transport system permease subunit
VPIVDTGDMWTTFGPDVLVAVIGAVLTVIIAYCTYLIQQRRTENHVINVLFWEINHRRGLYEKDKPRLG